MISRRFVLGLAFSSVVCLAACGDDTSAGTGGGGGAASASSASSTNTTSSAAQATSSSSASSGTASDGSGGGGANGSGGDGSGGGGANGSGGGGGSGGGALASCGDAPTVHVVTEISAYGSNAPIEGATITSDSCPGFSIDTDADGVASFEIAEDVPYTPKLVADGFVPMRTGEQILVADFEAGGQLYPTQLLALLPDWSEETPTLLALVAPGEGAAPGCDDPSGYVLSVVDHPEATIVYYSGTSTPIPDEDLEATGPLGIAEIAGLDATEGDALIELAADKDGCDASFASYPHTGRYVLENGVLTVAGAFVPPVESP